MRWLVWVSVAVSLPCVAFADDLGPPPPSCPAGSIGHSEHAGEWCAATTCSTDADCSGDGLRRQGLEYHHGVAGLVCREVALCVVEEEYTLGGLHPDPPPSSTRRVARGPCVGDACPSGGSCRSARRCAPAASRPAASQPTPARAGDTGEAAAERDDGGCEIGRAPVTPPWAFALALGALVAWRRHPS